MLSAKPEAEADNTNRGLNNSSYLRGPSSITVLLFICKYFFQDWGTFSLKKAFLFSPFQQKPHKLA